MVVGYIAKKLSERSKCSKCQLKLVTTESGIYHDDYLKQLPCGGLTTPSISLHDFIFQVFSIIDFILPKIKIITKNAYFRSVTERVLLTLGYSTSFTCGLHKVWSEKLAGRTLVNIKMTWLEKNWNLISERDKDRKESLFLS